MATTATSSTNNNGVETKVNAWNWGTIGKSSEFSQFDLPQGESDLPAFVSSQSASCESLGGRGGGGVVGRHLGSVDSYNWAVLGKSVESIPECGGLRKPLTRGGGGHADTTSAMTASSWGDIPMPEESSSSIRQIGTSIHDFYLTEMVQEEENENDKRHLAWQMYIQAQAMKHFAENGEIHSVLTRYLNITNEDQHDEIRMEWIQQATKLVQRRLQLCKQQNSDSDDKVEEYYKKCAGTFYIDLVDMAETGHSSLDIILKAIKISSTAVYD